MNKRSKKKPTKNSARLKGNGVIRQHLQIAKASLQGLWRRPLGNILTLAVISMALSMPACLYLMGKNIAVVAQNVTGPSSVSAYLQEGTADARAMIMKDEIEGWAQVAKVEYISPQQGLQELSEHAGFDQAISLLSSDALPGVLVVTPSDDDQKTAQDVSAQLRLQSGVTDVRLDTDWLARLDAIKALASTVSISLSLLMLGAVLLIVGNTLRFNVLENKESIQTMKLIGATDSYILRPYLYTGMWFGLLGAVFAWIFTAVITIVCNQVVEDLAVLYDSQFRLIGLAWDESLLLVIVGILLGCIAAKFSAQRHLKEIEPV